MAYFNCAYMSPLMHRVVEAGVAAVRRKAQPWHITPPDFFSDSERARSLFARLINADTDGIAIIPSASYGMAAACLNVAIDLGQTIITVQDQFPSNVYPWLRLAEERGASVVTVPVAAARRGDGAIDWTPAILDAIDDRCAVLALPHCHWTDGALIDLERIGAAARERGTALVLDITQSCGALPFDVTRIDPDFVVAAAYKWLLGPYSLGFLYVAPHHRSGRPVEENWIARRDSQDFAGLVNYKADYQPGARRFDMGERTNFHLIPMAIAALEALLDWGPDRIAETLGDRTGAIAAGLGLDTGSAALRAGHFLGVRVPGPVPDGLLSRLAEDRVFVSVRGQSMRVTPHLYNDEEDVGRLLDALHRAMTPAS